MTSLDIERLIHLSAKENKFQSNILRITSINSECLGGDHEIGIYHKNEKSFKLILKISTSVSCFYKLPFA